MNKKSYNAPQAEPYLRDEYELTVREIAEEFGMSQSAVSQLIQSASRKFHMELIKRLIEKKDLL